MFHCVHFECPGESTTIADHDTADSTHVAPAPAVVMPSNSSSNQYHHESQSGRAVQFPPPGAQVNPMFVDHGDGYGLEGAAAAVGSGSDRSISPALTS